MFPFTDFCEEILGFINSTQTLSQELLEILDVIFPGQLESALHLIDSSALSGLIASESRRVVYLAKGKQPYTVMPNYCSCPAFSFSVLKDTSYMCKHQLALRIALALGKVKFEEVKDADLHTYIH
ncbi:hypothetical protein GEMRC1_012852 [Eukaryota sp. GEM-RC1]